MRIGGEALSGCKLTRRVDGAGWGGAGGDAGAAGGVEGAAGTADGTEGGAGEAAKQG